MCSPSIFKVRIQLQTGGLQSQTKQSTLIIMVNGKNQQKTPTKAKKASGSSASSSPAGKTKLLDKFRSRMAAMKAGRGSDGGGSSTGLFSIDGRGSGKLKVICIWRHATMMNRKGADPKVCLALSQADEKIKGSILMSKPFAGSDQWLFSIKNTKKQDPPERFIWPKDVIVEGQEIKARVTCWWEYNGSLSYEQLVKSFSELPNLSAKKWIVKGMDFLPLDTIYLKQHLAEHLTSDTTVVDDQKPEQVFGGRYQFASFEEFFNDSEVQELTQDTADSQDAIAGLA